MDCNIAAVTVTVDERVFCPASLVWAHAATSNHLLHIICQKVVVRCQAQLAGDHLRRKWTCEDNKDEPKPLQKILIYPLWQRFWSHFAEMSCFSRVYNPFRHRIFSTSAKATHRASEKKRPVGKWKCVITNGQWQRRKDGCDWLKECCQFAWRHFDSTWPFKTNLFALETFVTLATAMRGFYKWWIATVSIVSTKYQHEVFKICIMHTLS